jgi:photosystem II stability/assembly factor-like uncharacterized protein
MLSIAMPRRFGPAAVALAAAAGLHWAAGPAGAEGGGDAVDPSEPGRLVPSSLLLDIAGAGDRMVIVGERGHVLVSTDRGRTWTQSIAPTRSLLTAVFMVDEQTVWAVGHDAVILRSQDGGQTWERRHWAPDWESPLFDVWFETPERGLAIGAYGLFLETTDGGETWARKTVDEDEPHLYLMDRGPGGRLYIAGEFGSIYVSDDQGRTWDKRPSPYGGSFFGVLTLADQSVLVFGLRGNLLRSEDGGGSWESIPSGTGTGLFAGRQLNDDVVALFGQSGNICLSTDGGRTFEARNLGNRDGISSALVLEGNRLLLVGEGGIQLVEDVLNPVASPLAESGGDS